MKPTDEERREVAEKLREPFDVLPQGRYCHAHYTLFGMGLYASSEGALRLGVRRLADLIEPEERTCRNTAGKPFAGYRMFSCSECGAYLEVDGDTDANLFAGGERPMPRYCPNCGAKVVQE